MGCEPRSLFTARGETWRLEQAGRPGTEGEGNPLAKLDELVAGHRVESASGPELPFQGGAVGWFSYDLGRRFEAFGGTAAEDWPVPDIRLAWHDAAIVWDHREGGCWLVGVGWDRSPTEALEELAGWLRGPPLLPEASEAPPAVAFASDLSRAEYLARVNEARDRIARGEIYQMNLVQRFEGPHGELPAATYLRLRRLNPAPFAFFQDAGDLAVLGSSPERFLEITPSQRIRACPIKGTRPRGRTPAEDAARADELRSSEKERAELLMIVDLMRNDLGRLCEFGSVRCNRLHALESFATVHHLVGEVEGVLRPGTRVSDLLRATFPGGSITGAPKISALGLIDRLERHRRGIFMGATGYLSAHGRIDLGIAIRTIVCREKKAYFEVGAGIVWDSDAAAEYEETLAKGRALFAALGGRPSPP
jgi:para-aminobenzoate synthetase component 1